MGAFKNLSIDSEQVEYADIDLESFLRWLSQNYPQDDEILEILEENLSGPPNNFNPEFEDPPDPNLSSPASYYDIENILPSGYWNRLKGLLVEFLAVKSIPKETSLKKVTTLSDEAATEREWNFREDNNQHFYGDIPYNQKIITLTLNWKADKSSSPKLVGKYQIDLPALLDEGFVQEGSKGIKLRFQSTGDAIEIAIDRNSPALRVGSKPE